MAINKNFVVKNGLEVNENLIYADATSDRIGIKTTNPQHVLHVNGGIGVTNSVVTGISTINAIVITGTLSAGHTTGASNQYLASIGTGITWKSVVTPRTSTVYSAGIGSTSFSVSYTVGLVDAYINGVRLIPPPSPYAEFTASNGTDIFINDPCFGNEIVEIVVYNQI
jgi:hypothetical protein